MSKTPADTLRAVAALTLRRGRDGRTFPEAVELTADLFDRDGADAVRPESQQLAPAKNANAAAPASD